MRLPRTSQADGGAHHVTDAPLANAAAAEDKVPFHGRHQAGIVTPRPANGMIASFIVVADTVDDLEKLFRRLNERIVFLTSGGPSPETDPRLPPPDSGIIGSVIRPNALTITASLGSSLFEDRPWLQPHKPGRLARMTRFPNDALNAELVPRRPDTSDLRAYTGYHDPRAPRYHQEHSRPVDPQMEAGG